MAPRKYILSITKSMKKQIIYQLTVEDILECSSKYIRKNLTLEELNNQKYKIGD
jgi:hypothetical protein